jgi:hypothetical protein
MSGHLHVVFNRPPAGVSDEAFNRWALHHFREILEVPGWASARRFRLDPAYSFSSADDYRPPAEGLEAFRYMSLYEIEGDPAAAIAALSKEVESGRMEFPEWYQRAQDEKCFLSWNASAISDLQH